MAGGGSQETESAPKVAKNGLTVKNTNPTTTPSTDGTASNGAVTDPTAGTLAEMYVGERALNVSVAPPPLFNRHLGGA